MTHLKLIAQALGKERDNNTDNYFGVQAFKIAHLLASIVNIDKKTKMC